MSLGVEKRYGRVGRKSGIFQVGVGMLLGVMLYAFGMSKFFYRVLHIKWLYLQVKIG